MKLNHITWIFITFILNFSLVDLTEIKRQYLQVSKLKVESIAYNDSVKSFCSNKYGDDCIQKIDIHFNSKSFSFTNGSEVNSFDMDVKGPSLILSNASIISSGSTLTLLSMQTETFRYQTSAIILKHSKLEINLTLTINCQKNYMATSCNEVDLCKALPAVCKNDGSCIQENEQINLSCPEKFNRELCNQVLNPGKDQICGDNSTSSPDPKDKYVYRCNCTKGYSRTFLHLISDLETPKTMKCSTFIIGSAGYGYFCYCREDCKEGSVSANPTNQSLLPFKWPFSDLLTFIIMIVEGLVILLLIIALIIRKCASSPTNAPFCGGANTLSPTFTCTDSEFHEFGLNFKSQPVILEGFQNRNSINPLYDLNQMNSIGKGYLSVEGNDSSTFVPT